MLFGAQTILCLGIFRSYGATPFVRSRGYKYFAPTELLLSKEIAVPINIPLLWSLVIFIRPAINIRLLRSQTKAP